MGVGLFGVTNHAEIKNLYGSGDVNTNFTPNFRRHNKVNGVKIDLDPFPFDLNAWVKE